MTSTAKPQIPTEQQLLSAIAEAGKAIKEALGQLETKYRDRLLKRIQRHIPARMAARIEPEDVAQETSLKAFRGILSFQEGAEGSFYGWLAVIADNTLTDKVDALRTDKRGGGDKEINAVAHARSDFSAYAALLDVLAIDCRTPSASAARREAAAALRNALGQFDARQCAALILCHLHNWSRERGAEAMGISKNTLGSLLYRGLEKLRHALGNRSNYLSSK